MAEMDMPIERIQKTIYLVRGQKVMLDRDLAALYEVPTKVLKQAVKRHADRFPDDFMFGLDREEFMNWRSQFVTSNSDRMGLRHPPMAFTEQGVAMRAEQPACGAGEHCDHARLYAAAVHPGPACGPGAQTGRAGEEIRWPVPRGVRGAAPVDDSAGAAPQANRVRRAGTARGLPGAARNDVCTTDVIRYYQILKSLQVFLAAKKPRGRRFSASITAPSAVSGRNDSGAKGSCSSSCRTN